MTLALIISFAVALAFAVPWANAIERDAAARKPTGSPVVVAPLPAAQTRFHRRSGAGGERARP